MVRPLKLVFTHNFNKDRVENYIEAFRLIFNFRKSEGRKEENGNPISYRILSYREDDAELKEISKEFDALILTGGNDINPIRYGDENIHRKTKIMNSEKEKIDFHLIEYFLKENKNILGICLGCQELNVFFGGTLYQDIPDQINSNIHRKGQEDGVHRVKIEKDSVLYSLMSVAECEVISNHHQGIKGVGNGLKISAISVEDGLVEAIELADYQKTIVGIQWHPEIDVSTNEISKNLFRGFLNRL